jgi:hypothetical protein
VRSKRPTVRSGREAADELGRELGTRSGNGEDVDFTQLAGVYDSLASVAPPEIVPDLTAVANEYRAGRIPFLDFVDEAVHINEVNARVCP